MSIFEFDREEWERQVRTEEYEDGAYDTKIATARKALDCNIPRDVIATITGLSLDVIAAL